MTLNNAFVFLHEIFIRCKYLVTGSSNRPGYCLLRKRLCACVDRLCGCSWGGPPLNASSIQGFPTQSESPGDVHSIHDSHETRRGPYGRGVTRQLLNTINTASQRIRSFLTRLAVFINGYQGKVRSFQVRGCCLSFFYCVPLCEVQGQMDGLSQKALFSE